MANRRSYKPYRRNYGSGKKKWASFMKPASVGPVQIQGSGAGFLSATLVINSAETATPTPTIIKAKHFKANVDTYLSGPNQVMGPMIAYIIYIPQGYTVTTTTPTDHPEWVLSWRSIDTSSTNASLTVFHDSVTMSSSLSRNLNSGDSIRLLVIANNVASGDINLNALVHFSCVVRNN